MRDIRRVHPDLFDVEDAPRFRKIVDQSSFTLDLILYLERLLARAAFEKALGKTEDVLQRRGLDRQDCVEELTQFYETYGIAHAQGKHQAEVLIQNIESQAASQARSYSR
ncbi:hypothetical protein KIH39_18390 [Telmatocola sphagniphila]|uniref:Uncharacterized protein n=1 Tax=Telmatocola sphagniphila TaxID=1123043 RepID=A0A8E6B2T2_9BACT|nr:hypothetical protein [Telmatocola sphagniphila]QVL30807.1 hypothetical protein KIH39_18390 [Telmatocola sphagniphila]